MRYRWCPSLSPVDAEVYDQHDMLRPFPRTLLDRYYELKVILHFENTQVRIIFLYVISKSIRSFEVRLDFLSSEKKIDFHNKGSSIALINPLSD